MIIDLFYIIRLEIVNLKKICSFVKVIGIVIMVGGVMVMMLYKGLVIEFIKVVYIFIYGGFFLEIID